MTTGTVDHNYAASTKGSGRNAYDTHPRGVALTLRRRDWRPWKLTLPENSGAKMTDITLSANTVAHDATVGTNVGTFAAVGGKSPYTTLLTDPSGKFEVAAGVLKVKATPIPAGTYLISYRLTDASGQVFNKSFNVIST